MVSKKILVVLGATGNQGGSVVKVLLDDPKTAEQFEIRGITRDPTKSASVALAAKGVTLLKADLNDKESLRIAFKDAYAVFSITDWVSILDKEKEIQQGKNAADIANELGVQHFIWSSLPYVSKMSGGKYTAVAHFDSKAIVEEYIRTLPLPATFLQLPVFMNYTMFYCQPISLTPEQKTYKIALPIRPSSKIPMIAVHEDVGKYVKGILLNREKVLGKSILAGEKYYNMDDIARILKDVGGLDVVAEEGSETDLKAGLERIGFPEFMVQGAFENLRYFQDFGYYGGASLEDYHDILDEPLVSYEEWVKGSKEVAAMK